ncbi:MAG: MATE family efflux transporter [Blautia sp.]|nr:MATE family efflux transporter [Blautia sp.]
MAKTDYLEIMRNGGSLDVRQQLFMTAQLSIPAILAQISTVIMEYIDASMVGRLGAGASAAIGLVSSTTWLFGGLIAASSMGFTVQVAHRIGAGDGKGARGIVKHGLSAVILISGIVMLLGLTIGGFLPAWLGGDEAIRNDASAYFRIFALMAPAMAVRYTSGGMLQGSGNMKVPGMLNIMECVLDVVFNFFLIFPTRKINLSGISISCPGAGLGVTGAALGTGLSEVVCAGFMLYFLLGRSKELHLRKGERHVFEWKEMTTAARISVPIAVENAISGTAYVAVTRIISPLGTIALAAHSFGITAEGLCYMPGYGISSAATTMIGQSIGAGRSDMTKKLAWISVGLGMLVMTGTGVLMYVFAPQMIGILTPDPEIRALGARVLRIEAFAEPMFAASIVASGVFRGAGDTLVPAIMNFVSMWVVRITLASFLAPKYGLPGMWTAMCIELWFRGMIFLIRLFIKTKSGFAVRGKSKKDDRF